jgi:hypothetical protein
VTAIMPWQLGGVVLKEVFGQVLIEPDLAVLLG